MHRLAIKEGWTTFLLVALVAMCAVWSIEAADWVDGLGMLTTIAVLALATGLALSLAPRVPPLLAHLVALTLGAVVVLWSMTRFLSDELGGRSAKLHYLWHHWQEWYSAVSHGQRAEDLYLFVLLMAALVWLVCYLTVWLVFKAHWIWLSLVLPGVILFANLGYSLKVPTGLLVLYLFSSLLLLMRFSFARREERWRRGGIPYPNTLVWRALWVASYVSLAILLFGWVFPLSTQSREAALAWQRVNSPWVEFRDTLNSWFGGLRGPNAAGGPGGFAAFSDQFQVGGPLKLSPDPVVVVKGGSAPYLVAHRYSTFTGTSWKSDDDASQSAQLPFAANQQFPLPSTSATARTPSQYEVDVLRTRGAVVYGAEEPGTVSVPTEAQVSSYYYQNQALDLSAANAQTTPPLLWPLVQALQTADFQPPPAIDPNRQTPTPSAEATPDATPEATPGPLGTPAATPGAGRSGGFLLSGSGVNVTPPAGTRSLGQPSNWRTIQQAVADLSLQHQIQTEIVVGQDFKVTTLRFTGRLPVYSDVEAIYSQNGVRNGDSYSVTAEVSQATVDQLRGASNEYPTEIASRYLQLPAVTPRVSQLAHDLTDPAQTEYDKASAVENFLRTNYKYREDVPAPPKGHDIVDYFLFDNKEGYCTYYSSAMVELLRVVGIPAREVAGFYPASYDNNSAGFLYRDLNSHAWVEVYFPGYGWIPFEPTAARGPISRYQPPAPASDTATDGPGGVGQVPPSDGGRLPDEGLIDVGPAGGAVATTHHTGPLGWAVRGGIVGLLILAAIFTFLWLRGLRGLTPATQLYTKLQRAASWGGVPVRPSMTPFEYARAVSERVPGARTHAGYLADLYVRERYGSYDTATDDISRARHAWLRLRGLLLQHALLKRWRPYQPPTRDLDD